MKRLTIIYNDATLFDADVAELVWSDIANGVKVEGKIKRSTSGGAEGLMGVLTGLSKGASKKMADEKRAEYAGEDVEVE